MSIFSLTVKAIVFLDTHVKPTNSYSYSHDLQLVTDSMQDVQ